MMEQTRISFIGGGRVGTSLAYLLNNRGYRVIGITSRSIASAERAARFMGNDIACSDDIYVFVEESDIVFVTTNDDMISGVVAGLAAACHIREGQIFAHASGSLRASVFAPVEEKGGLGISIHPLQTVANPTEGVKNIIGSLFAIEGDERAYDAARKIVDSLEGKAYLVDGDKKPLYHLAAVMACNYFVSLVDTSLGVFESIGFDRDEALQGILKLVRGTVNNLDRLGTKGALTGPIARGDCATIADHIEAMKTFAPDLMPLYRTLGERTVELALEKGSLDREGARKIRELLAQMLTKR